MFCWLVLCWCMCLSNLLLFFRFFCVVSLIFAVAFVVSASASDCLKWSSSKCPITCRVWHKTTRSLTCRTELLGPVFKNVQLHDSRWVFVICTVCSFYKLNDVSMDEINRYLSQLVQTALQQLVQSYCVDVADVSNNICHLHFSMSVLM